MDSHPVPHSSSPAIETIVGDSTYLLLKTTQQKMGVGRVKLGALLCVIQENETWKGRTGSNTFRKFLIEEGIEPKAAMQYMLVAKTFVLDLGISAHDLNAICTASMRNLCLAAKIVRPQNLQEIMDILRSLPRAEAMYALKQMTPEEHPMGDKVPDKQPVSKILNQVDELNMEQRADLYRHLGVNKQNQLPYHSHNTEK